MTTLQRIIPAMLVLVAYTATNAQTADEILEKHEIAMGGLSNWDKITTMKMTGKTIVMGREVGMTYTLVTNKAMRIETRFNGYTNYQVLTINNNWIGFPHVTSGKADTISRENAFFFWPQLNMECSQLLNYKTSGIKAVYAGKDTIENMACDKIKYTDKIGNEITAFFDISTYYLLRIETVLTVNEEQRDYYIAYHDYKKQNGVALPMSFNTPNGETVFTSVQLNLPVDDSIFKPTPPIEPGK